MVWCTTPEKGRSWGAGQVLRLLMGIPKLGAPGKERGGAPPRDWPVGTGDNRTWQEHL